MRKTIRSLSVAVVFCLLAAFLPLMGDKALTACAGGDFTVVDGVLTKYNGSGGAVTIPNGVTAIGKDVFNGNTSVTSVTMPDSVTKIGSWAFYECSNLRTVKLSASLQTVGTSAFCYCRKLESVTLPDSLTTLSNGAFKGCEKLTSVTLPKNLTTIGSDAFARCSSLTSIQLESGNTAFAVANGVLFSKDMTVLRVYPAGKTAASYTVPSSVTAIGNYAFSGAKYLQTVSLPEGLKTIGEGGFYGCDKLSGVTLPSTLTTIDDSAFWRCPALTTLRIPAGVTTIGSGIVAQCRSLSSIEVASGNTAYIVVNDMLMTADRRTVLGFPPACSRTSVTLPDTVTKIGFSAFRGCENLTSVTLSPAVKDVDNYVFEYCTGLTSVTIPGGVKELGYEMFYGCSSLTSVTIPSSVEKIRDYAFARCSSLKTVNMLATAPKLGSTPFNNAPVTTVNYSGTSDDWSSAKMNTAFNGSPAVNYNYYPDFTVSDGVLTAYTGSDAYVTVPVTVNNISSSAFENCDFIKEITIPKTVTTMHEWAFDGCTSLTAINVAENNPSFSSADGILFNKSKTRLVRCPVGKAVGSYTIPSTVTTIGNSAFYKCDGLTSVEIPNSVTTLESYAFDDCDGLTAFTVPANVTSVADYVFGSSNNLRTVTILGKSAIVDDKAFGSLTVANIRVNYVGSESEWNASGWKNVLSGAKVTFNYDPSFTIVDGVLTEYNGEGGDVVIPSGVTAIGESAFYSCDSLTSVTIPSGVTTIGKKAFYDCYALKSVTIPGSVTTIGESAFENCASLTSVTIPSSVTTIGESAFEYCTSLKSVTIPSSVTTIGASAFYSCDSLTSVTIPSGVTTIGASAFEDCYALASVTVSEGVTTIGDNAFEDCTSLTGITIPASVTSIGDCVFDDCTALTAISVAGGNPHYCSVDGVLFSKDKTTLLCYPEGKTAASYTVPSTVTKIGNSAMYNCDHLTSVTLPASLTVLDDYALCSCDALTAITIPANVTTVEYMAFINCDALKTVTILAKSPSVSSSVFYNSPVETVNYAGSEDEWNASEWKGAFNSSATVTYNYSALSVTTQPKDATGAVDSKVTFTVAAEGSGISYKWYYKKADASSWTAWKNGTSASLTAPVYASWNGTKFYCKLTDSSGKSINSGSAKMLVATKITQQPTDATGAVNDKVTFTVKATGAGISYKWYYKKASDSTWTEWKNGTSASLTATVYNSWNNAKFYCKLTDANGKTVNSGSARMIVGTPLAITTQPKDATGAVNEKVTFSIKATGSGISYKWYYKKADASTWTEWKNGTSATLTAPVYASWNNAKFYCKLTDSSGKTLNSNSVKMIVAAPLAITTQPKDASGAVDSKVTFTVVATGSGISYKWYYKKPDASSWTAWKNGTSATLTAPVYASWNGTKFYCKLTDSSGKTLNSNSVKMYVTTKITQQPANASGAVNDKVTFTVKATGAGISYKWYYKKADASSWTEWKNGTSASLTATVYNSWNNAKFYCKITDANGKTINSGSATLTVK